VRGGNSPARVPDERRSGSHVRQLRCPEVQGGAGSQQVGAP
jgi:hypothetical protein